MLKKFFAIALLLTTSPIWAEGDQVNVSDLPQLIQERNEHVQAARLLVDAAQRETGYLRRSFLPELEAEAGQESFRTGTEDQRSEPFGTVGAQLNVFRSGKDRLEEKGRSTANDFAEAELEATVRTQLKEARETFWLLAFQREMLSVLAKALEKNDLFLKAANRKIDSGLSTSTDQLEFEIQRRELEQNVARLRTEEMRAQKTLALLVANSAPVNTPPQVPHDHDDQIMNSIFESGSHPTIRTLNANAKNEGLVARQANRWWAPSVDLYSNYSLYTFREREYDKRSDRDETVAGGKVSMDLFDGLHSRTKYRGATLRAESFSKHREQMEKKLLLDVESTKAALQQLHDLVHSSIEGVALGDRYLKNTLDEYTRGVKNSPDLLGALEKSIDARRRDAEIRLDYQMEKVGLLNLLGL